MVNTVSAESLEALFRQGVQFSSFCKQKHPLTNSFNKIETLLYEKLVIGGNLLSSVAAFGTSNDVQEAPLSNALSLMRAACLGQEVFLQTDGLCVQQMLCMRNAIRSRFNASVDEHGVQPGDLQQAKPATAGSQLPNGSLVKNGTFEAPPEGGGGLTALQKLKGNGLSLPGGMNPSNVG